MDPKTRFLYRLLFGITIIAGVIFLSFRFLLRSPPLIKVMAIGLIIGTTYLVVNYLKKNKDT